MYFFPSSYIELELITSPHYDSSSSTCQCDQCVLAHHTLSQRQACYSLVLYSHLPSALEHLLKTQMGIFYLAIIWCTQAKVAFASTANCNNTVSYKYTSDKVGECPVLQLMHHAFCNRFITGTSTTTPLCFTHLITSRFVLCSLFDMMRWRCSALTLVTDWVSFQSWKQNKAFQ